MPPATQPNLSGQTAWLPACPEFMLDAFSRIQIRGHRITPEHMIEARRSANFILSDYSNRGVNLWKVGDADIRIALIPEQEEYQLPIDTADLLDCYLNYYTPGSFAAIGNALTPFTDHTGAPITASPYGDVLTLEPSSQTLSAVKGSTTYTLSWPAGGVVPSSPIFWGCPVSIGGVVLSGFIVVSGVSNTGMVTFTGPPALETQTLQGATALYETQAGSSIVTVYLPGHGAMFGGSFTVSIPLTIGGLVLSGAYPVTSVIPNNIPTLPSYSFTINVGAAASSQQTLFENNGQIAVGTQSSSTITSIFLWPISRDDYAMIPVKKEPGNPTTYWFNRTIQPSVLVWPVPPIGSTLGFVGYRMKDPQVFNPGMGQTPDIPRRAYAAFVAELTAYLAEKYKPSVFAEKAQLAMAAWSRFSSEDREKVTLRLVPELMGYFQ